jgi:hypothetical protein
MNLESAQSRLFTSPDSHFPHILERVPNEFPRRLYRGLLPWGRGLSLPRRCHSRYLRLTLGDPAVDLLNELLEQ